MSIALLQVPYDSGQCERRAGLGPGALLRGGLVENLTSRAGIQVVPTRIDTDLDFPLEAGVGFDLARKLSGDVGRVRRSGALPIVLSGGCLVAAGTVAGLQDVPRLGVVWLDAHGDLTTPETSASGFIDGMALSVVTGRCWQGAAGTIPGFAPIPDAQVLHLGARTLDPFEESVLRDAALASVGGAAWAAPDGERTVVDAVADLARCVDALYLHIDMDVHDGDEIWPSPFAVPGGPSVRQVRRLAAYLCNMAPVAALGLTNYAPEVDPSGAAQDAAIELVTAAAGQITARG